MMKCLFILLLMFHIPLWATSQTTQSTQTMITGTADDRLPAEVKAKLSGLVTPGDVKAFTYKGSKVFADKELSTIRQNVTLSFSNGMITGKITTIKSEAGFEPKKISYTVAICFSYCCIDENGKADCTTNYQDFLKNRNSDKCKKTTSHPCE